MLICLMKYKLHALKLVTVMWEKVRNNLLNMFWTALCCQPSLSSECFLSALLFLLCFFRTFPSWDWMTLWMSSPTSWVSPCSTPHIRSIWSSSGAWIFHGGRAAIWRIPALRLVSQTNTDLCKQILCTIYKALSVCHVILSCSVPADDSWTI